METTEDKLRSVVRMAIESPALCVGELALVTSNCRCLGAPKKVLGAKTTVQHRQESAERTEVMELEADNRAAEREKQASSNSEPLNGLRAPTSAAPALARVCWTERTMSGGARPGAI